VDTCPSCGARVSAEASWCGQCLATLARPDADAPGYVPGTLAARRPPPREEPHVPTYSRLRGSPTSFGPVGRVILSLLTVMGLIIGYPMMRGLMVATVGIDVPGRGFVAMYATIAITAGLYLLSRIWKPTRVS
jgi:hypothetical protein